MLAAYAARRRPDRYAGIAFTHGLTQTLRDRLAARCAGRAGSRLTLLDALPPAKKAFTRAMLFGLS